MTSERQRLRPWLEDMITSGDVPGLSWLDPQKTRFKVSWKHAGKPDFEVDRDAVLFRKWAEHTGKYRSGESPDPSTWKTRFRCALHKMPDIDEVKVPRSLDGDHPYRVFQFKPRGAASAPREYASPPSSATSPTMSSSRNGPLTSSHRLSDYRHASESFPIYLHRGEDPNIFFNGNLSIMDDGLFDQKSDDSYDDSIDSITPTIPQQSPPNNMAEIYYRGGWGMGYIEAQMETEGESNTFHPFMFTGQQAMQTSSMLGFLTDESEVKLSDAERAEIATAARKYRQKQDCTMEIKIFYDRKEIECLEITKQESDRTVRLSTMSPEKLHPRLKSMNTQYHIYYGSLNAKQVVLPLTSTSNVETQEVLQNMDRGLILRMTDEGDVYASRLCLSRVFCTNGTKEATKLNRDGQIKVFDYQKVFLPKLRMSSTGNCAPPSYDITFNLGRADGSLVAIIVTHAQAKKQVGQSFCSMDRIVSEPNPDDQMLESQSIIP